MSRFVPTRLGVFRQWKTDIDSGFLFLCPKCGQWIPMDEERLAGSKPIDHELIEMEHGVLMGRGRYCSYIGVREYGKWLVATLQARVIMASDGEDIRTYVEDEAEAIREAEQARKAANIEW